MLEPHILFMQNMLVYLPPVVSGIAYLLISQRSVVFITERRGNQRY